MSEKVIAYILQNDLTDRTQLQVYNNTPSAFPLGASSVPSYLYQSLKTLWVGASADTTYFQQKIAQDTGSGDTTPAGMINISLNKEFESALNVQGSYQADNQGAVIAPISVALVRPKGLETSTDRVLMSSLRIMYILDVQLRGVQVLPGQLPLTAVYQDNTIDSRYPYICSYQSRPESIRSAEAQLLFAVNYTRLFTK